MKLYRINRTAWSEDDIYINSSLTAPQIKSAIRSMVKEDDGSKYKTTDYVEAMRNCFPLATVLMAERPELITF